MPTYTVRIVERDGTVVRTLVGANYVGRSRPLNGNGEIRWNYPKYDPPGAAGQGADVTPFREVQILRDGAVFDWGIVLDPEASSGDGALHMTSPRFAWPFTRRFIDRPITNLLDNGSFEAGVLTPWTALGTGITATLITSPRNRGGYAARLVQANPGVDSHLDQTVSVPTTAVGDLLTLAADVLIESWSDAAYDGRGLYVEVRDGSDVLKDVQSAEYDFTKVGQWQELRVQTQLPASVTWPVNVRLYAPDGSIVVDEIRLVKQESLSSAGPPGTDIGSLFAQLVLFIQGNLPGLSSDWDDLSILVDDAFTTGTLLATSWPFANKTPADRAIGELVEMDGGIDWSAEVIAGAKWVVAHFPRKGTDRSVGVSLTYGPGGNVASYSITPGAGSVVTRWVGMGGGSGPERQESYKADATATDGLMLGGVFSLPPGVPVEQLDPMTTDRLNRTKQVTPGLEMITYQGAADLVGLLEEGDRVIVFIDDGNVQIGGDPYRITAIDHAARNETLRVALVADPDGGS